MSNSNTNQKWMRLIYGDNGTGKSQYYEKKSKDSEYIVLNYSVSKWYRKKQFSEWNYKKDDFDSEIAQKTKKVIKDISNDFGCNEKECKESLKHISFIKPEDWLSWKKEIKIENTEKKEKNYSNIFNVLIHFDNYKEKIRSLSNESFDLLKVYSSLKYSKIDENKLSKKAIAYQNKILYIIQELKKEIDSPDLEQLSELNIDILEKIRINDDINVSEIVNLIKNIIIINNYQEINDICDLEIKKEKVKKKCLNFKKLGINKYEKIFKNKQIEISVDKSGYSLNFDIDDFSDGEKIVLLFEILLEAFSRTGKILLLDDVFEKLDIQNIYNLLFDLFTIYKNSSNMRIEILTHDVNFFEMFKKMTNDFPDHLERVKYKIIDYQTKTENFEIKKYPFALTFKDYLKNMLSDLKNNEDFFIDEINDHILFAKLFNREPTMNNWSHFITNQQSYKSQIENNFTVELYAFLSENIFHYENKIEISKYKLIEQYFNYDGFFSDPNLNTVILYEKLINKFEAYQDKEEKWGLKLVDVAHFLKKLLKFIKREESFYQQNIEKYSSDMTKKQFYKELYDGMDQANKKERNRLFHILEYSLKFE